MRSEFADSAKLSPCRRPSSRSSAVLVLGLILWNLRSSLWCYSRCFDFLTQQCGRSWCRDLDLGPSCCAATAPTQPCPSYSYAHATSSASCDSRTLTYRSWHRRSATHSFPSYWTNATYQAKICATPGRPWAQSSSAYSIAFQNPRPCWSRWRSFCCRIQDYSSCCHSWIGNRQRVRSCPSTSRPGLHASIESLWRRGARRSGQVLAVSRLRLGAQKHSWTAFFWILQFFIIFPWSRQPGFGLVDQAWRSIDS